MTNNLNTCYRNHIAFLILCIVIFLIYSNTFNASWQYDDYFNIVNNPSLHIKDLSYNSIQKTFYTRFESGMRMYRPVSCMTFALNWYLGKVDTTGYHIVNTIIHCLTACLLFISIINIFKTPFLKKQYTGDQYFIALLAATLWAINPIQTQAVTYIVQRMASLAAMFYVLSIYCYIKARISTSTLNRFFLFLGCIVSFLFALGSKENAVMLPATLVLIEIVFFHNFKLPKIKNKFFLSIFAIGLIIVLFYILVINNGNSPLFFLKGYEHRTFSFMQRLMTSPRVIIFYLSQIFYPAPQRFAIKHDVEISTSCFEPWTTMPSFLIIVLLICIGLFSMRKKPLISFAILFFFLNHIIESSIFPLELIYEHRNYLPSLFLFLPVATYFKSGIDYYQQKNRVMHMTIISFVIFLFIGIGTGTYIRNMTWATEKSLWEDVLKKSPGLAIPYNKLGTYYQDHKLFDKAIWFYSKAIALKAQSINQYQISSLYNMGNIFIEKRDYKKAIVFYKKALDISPENERALYNLIVGLTKLGMWKEASAKADILLSMQNNKDATSLNLKGLILLKQEKFKEALHYLRNALFLVPDYNYSKIYIGTALSSLNYYKRAELFLKMAYQTSPNDITIIFCLIENSIRSGDNLKVDFYLENLFSTFSVKEISNALEGLTQDSNSMPVSLHLLKPVVAKKMIKISKKISGNRISFHKNLLEPIIC